MKTKENINYDNTSTSIKRWEIKIRTCLAEPGNNRSVGVSPDFPSRKREAGWQSLLETGKWCNHPKKTYKSWHLKKDRVCRKEAAHKKYLKITFISNIMLFFKLNVAQTKR